MIVMVIAIIFRKVISSIYTNNQVLHDEIFRLIPIISIAFIFDAFSGVL